VEEEEEEEDDDDDDDDDDDGDDEKIMYIHTQYPEAQRNLERENKKPYRAEGMHWLH